MKLIIDIDKNDYENMKNGYVPSTFNLFYVIKNGIPLPKGHGRIIDESQITGTFTWDNGYIECFAPTIIEADRAESEDKE